jgi:membrane protein required for colicin V production
MLTWVDLVLLGIVGISCLVGLLRGFIVEVMSLVVWLAAFWLAFVFGADAAQMFEPYVEAASARLLLGYTVLFVAALMVGGLATWLIGRMVKATGLSGTDRLLGLGFGLLRGAALGCILVLVLGFTPMPAEAWWKESRLLPGFQRGAEWMRAWLPEAVASYIRFDGTPAALPAAPSLPELSQPPSPVDSRDNTPPVD